MTSVGEPLHLDHEHVVALSDGLRVYDRLDITIDQPPSEADDEEIDDSIYEERKDNAYADSGSDPILVELRLRNGVLSLADPTKAATSVSQLTSNATHT
ncbi:hypothetical protein LTR70_009959 [Exophiala xenobiotica]|uniref:Uncharacterized protein n=1 Tax=Lithohypha guttulata TaxID=1690604 RepID=A0ABR0K093_9EURO|nr:hypothetical protein LTR24_008360 [Lithohypha guttulata]KAK5309815.1 hypothetical protein LTR70_009959 [Exophiala xenobiotica]